MNDTTLLAGKPYRGIIKFMFPLLIANVLQQLYNTVDTLVVGNLDSQFSLSAVGTCGYLVGLYLAIASGFSLGVGVLVSKYYGAEDYESMKRYAGNGMIFLTALGIETSIIALLTNGLWLRYVINVPDNLYEAALKYIQFYSLGLLFQFIYNIIAALLRAVGDSLSSLYFLLISSVLNIILDLLFVGVFHLSVVGVALATMISQFICMLIYIIYMGKKYTVFRYHKNEWKLNGCFIKDIFYTGLPMSLQLIITSCGFMVIQRIVNSFGDVLIASYTVVCRLECYMLVPLTTLSQAMITFTGQNIGAKKYDRIQQGLHQTIGISLGIAFLISVVCYIYTPSLITLFGISGDAFAYAVKHLHVVCVDLILFSLYQPFSGLFQGIGKGIISTLMSFLELLTRILFSFILSFIVFEACSWWSEPIAFILVLLFTYRYYICVKKHNLLFK